MTTPYTTALIVTVTADRWSDYREREVRLNGHLVGYRWGSSADEIADEVTAAVTALLREQLGWPQAENEASDLR